MGKRSKEVDAYIAKAAPFAQPILEKIREAFHKASPEIVETKKWGVPHFEQKGIVGGMAGFKAHVNWVLWKAALMKDPEALFPKDRESGISVVRITKVSELPSQKVMVAYIREAIALNEDGTKIKRPPRKPRPPLQVPEDLAAALRKNAKARKTFDAFPPSHRREYLEWILEAKQQATRERRLATTIEWLSEGKSMNWRYTK